MQIWYCINSIYGCEFWNVFLFPHYNYIYFICGMKFNLLYSNAQLVIRTQLNQKVLAFFFSVSPLFTNWILNFPLLNYRLIWNSFSAYRLLIQYCSTSEFVWFDNWWKVQPLSRRNMYYEKIPQNTWIHRNRKHYCASNPRLLQLK